MNRVLDQTSNKFLYTTADLKDLFGLRQPEATYGSGGLPVLCSNTSFCRFHAVGTNLNNSANISDLELTTNLNGLFGMLSRPGALFPPIRLHARL